MLWDRRADEPAKAFAGFLCYRELPAGERTIDAAYELYSGNAVPLQDRDEEPAVEDGHDVDEPAPAAPPAEDPKPGVPDSIAALAGSPGTGHGKKLKRRARKKAPGYFYDYSRTYEWKMRAEAYDTHKLDLIDEGIRLVTGKSAEAIAEQRVRLKNEAALLSFQLLQQAREMIRWPLKKTQRKEDGDKTTINIAPAKWTKQTATRYAQIAVDLGKFGLEIKDDESDATPETFANQFFKSPDESSKAFPVDALPQKPGEPGALAKSINEPPMAGDAAAHILNGGNGRGKQIIQPSRPVRPETDRDSEEGY